jgi:hypothetical protein
VVVGEQADVLNADTVGDGHEIPCFFLIPRSGHLAASRRMSNLMVRDGARAPPHHEASNVELIANKKGNATNGK